MNRNRRPPSEFANLVTLHGLRTNGHPCSLAGQAGSADDDVDLLSGAVMRGEPRIVRVGRYWTEFVPQGSILFCRNRNQPGMIGRVGTILGKAHVNIRRMDVGPSVRPPWAGKTGRAPDTALMIISVDDPIPDWALEQIKGTADILGVAMVTL